MYRDLKEGSLSLGDKAKINAYWQVNRSLRIHYNFLAGCDSRYLILNPQGRWLKRIPFNYFFHNFMHNRCYSCFRAACVYRFTLP